MNELIVIETASKTIVGDLISKTETSVRIKNPAALFIQPSNSGQLSVQLFPLFFGELIETSEREQGTVWEFNTSGCGVSENIKLDTKLINNTHGFLIQAKSLHQLIPPRLSNCLMINLLNN